MLEDLISEAHSLGWYVYSIHENPGRRDRWDVTLRKADETGMWVAHGQGLELADAFEMALDSAPETCVPEKVNYTIDKTSVADVMKKFRTGPKISRRLA